MLDGLVSMVQGIGFDDLADALLSITALRYYLVWLEAVALGLFVTVLALNYVDFVESYIYAPYFSYVMYNVSIFGNIALGVIVAMRVHKERFDFSKVLRGFGQAVGQNGLLAYAFNLARADSFYVWFPITVWVALTFLCSLKILRNAALLDWIEGKLADLLIKQFSDKFQIHVKNDSISDISE